MARVPDGVDLSGIASLSAIDSQLWYREQAEKARTSSDEMRARQAALRDQIEELEKQWDELEDEIDTLDGKVDFFDRQARLCDAEIVGECGHADSNTSKVLCALPLNHEERYHENADGTMRWVDPSEARNRWCWRCFSFSSFTRMEAVRDDGAKIWVYQDERGHLRQVG